MPLKNLFMLSFPSPFFYLFDNNLKPKLYLGIDCEKEMINFASKRFLNVDFYMKDILIDELFNESMKEKNNKSFVQLISVKTASPAGFKTVNPGPIDVTEYILFYVKNRNLNKYF